MSNQMFNKGMEALGVPLEYKLDEAENGQAPTTLKESIDRVRHDLSGLGLFAPAKVEEPIAPLPEKARISFQYIVCGDNSIHVYDGGEYKTGPDYNRDELAEQMAIAFNDRYYLDSSGVLELTWDESGNKLVILPGDISCKGWTPSGELAEFLHALAAAHGKLFKERAAV